jgi:hypothetical protein
MLPVSSAGPLPSLHPSAAIPQTTNPTAEPHRMSASAAREGPTAGRPMTQ